jgi:hypothetical protein
MDPELWKVPEEFNPDRFLNNDGSFNKDKLLPFGLGTKYFKTYNDILSMSCQISLNKNDLTNTKIYFMIFYTKF